MGLAKFLPTRKQTPSENERAVIRKKKRPSKPELTTTRPRFSRLSPAFSRRLRSRSATDCHAWQSSYLDGTSSFFSEALSDVCIRAAKNVVCSTN